MKLISTLLVFWFATSNIQSDPACDILKNLKETSKLHYRSATEDGIVTDDFRELNEESFHVFYGREKASSEKSYPISKFKIGKNRTGVINFNTSVEGDMPIASYYLHVVENCKVIHSYLIMTSDSNTILYNVSSTFQPNFRTIAITEETTNETNDTLFQKIWKIDLRSKALDTISIKKQFTKLQKTAQIKYADLNRLAEL